MVHRVRTRNRLDRDIHGCDVLPASRVRISTLVPRRCVRVRRNLRPTEQPSSVYALARAHRRRTRDYEGPRVVGRQPQHEPRVTSAILDQLPSFAPPGLPETIAPAECATRVGVELRVNRLRGRRSGGAEGPASSQPLLGVKVMRWVASRQLATRSRRVTLMRPTVSRSQKPLASNGFWRASATVPFSRWTDRRTTRRARPSESAWQCRSRTWRTAGHRMRKQLSSWPPLLASSPRVTRRCAMRDPAPLAPKSAHRP